MKWFLKRLLVGLPFSIIILAFIYLIASIPLAALAFIGIALTISFIIIVGDAMITFYKAYKGDKNEKN